MQPLNAKSLSSLSAPVSTPTYERDRVRTGIVHFGVGGFHRSHQAMYLDRLMCGGKALDWGICGVGVLPSDRRMKDAMEAQDCLYTLVVKRPDGSLEPRVIGSIVQYLFAPDDPEAVIEKLADEQTRIVSLTVTEDGYNFHAVTGEFDVSFPDVVHDPQPGTAPKTTFGLITKALIRRRRRDLPPLPGMSCDNIPGNGDAARKSFVGIVNLVGCLVGDDRRRVDLGGEELGSWPPLRRHTRGSGIRRRSSVTVCGCITASRSASARSKR